MPALPDVLRPHGRQPARRHSRFAASSTARWCATALLATVSLAGQNLVKVKFAADKADEALKLLSALPVAGYAASIAELRGDILLSQGKRDEARSAYQASLDALEPMAPGRQGLEMKLDDAGGAAPAVAVATTEKQNS